MASVIAVPRTGTPRTHVRFLFTAHLPVGCLILISVSLFLFQLSHHDLIRSHEARAAQHAQRMIDTGEWGLPTLYDGQRDMQKPPGYYWLAAAAGMLNGGTVTPWAARFPAAAAAVCVVLLLYWFLRREGYSTGALFAAIALATANHFVAIGRTARIDLPLTCAAAVALLSCYVLVNRPASAWASRAGLLCASALSAAFAVLLKGPVALALIGPVAAGFLLLERYATAADDRPRLPLSWALLGLLIVAAAATPWFLWANHATSGEFARVFFWHHNVERFTGESETLASHPWWYYGPRFFYAFLPWTLLLVPALFWGFRSGLWHNSRLFRFGVLWLAMMLAVLSASHFKRADYLLPAFPGAAIIFGVAAERWLASRTQARSVIQAKWVFGVLLVFALAVWPVMWWIVEPREAMKQEKRPFAAAIREHAPQPRTVLLFRTESHLLAYHLRPPLHTLVEWGELKEILSSPGPHTVVMPPEYVADAERITGQTLIPVATLAEHTIARPYRPLVCFRTAK